MKRILFALAAVATIGFSAADGLAWAGRDRGGSAPITGVAGNPVYDCTLSGSISGFNVAVIGGGQYLGGDGYLTCATSASTGRVVRSAPIPVRMELVGGGFGFEVSYIRNVTVQSSGIGVNDPNDLFRQFSVGASAGAALISRGVSYDAAIRIGDGSGFGFDLGLQGQDIIGLGAHLYGMGFVLSRR